MSEAPASYEVYATRPIPEQILSRVPGLRVKTPSKGAPGPGWWEEARKARVVIVWFERVTREMLESPGSVGLVIARSSGYDHIDVEAAEEQGVCVANQPEIITEAVAEAAVAGILAALRMLVERHNHTPKWSVEGWPRHLAGGLLWGRTLGLLGAGRIAASIVAKLAPYNPERILYYSRTPKPHLEAIYGAERVSLEELFRESDVLVNSLPLTRETRGLVRAEHLLSMPRNAVYVNVGRGGTEQSDAVVVAARERPDLYLVLDVHPEEPIPPGSPRLHLHGRPRTILTPHTAGYSIESMIGTTLLALLQAQDYLRNGCVWNPVSRACKPCPRKPVSFAWAMRVAREIAVELGL